MSVKTTPIYTLSFSRTIAPKVLGSLALSPIQFEVLNPHDLGTEWKKVHFLPAAEAKLDTKTLELALDFYKPKGLLAGLMDNRVKITASDVALASQSSDYILDLAQKLVEYNTVKVQLQVAPESVENQVKLKELFEYFELRQVDPENLQPENYAKIAALHTAWENQQNSHQIAKLAFVTEENAETAFTFVAVNPDQKKVFEELLSQNSIDFEQTEWTQEIVVWKNKGGLSAFQSVAQSLGTIGTKEVDPSPVVAVMWMTFFAFAFGDGLYALIVAAFTGYLYFFRNLKPGIKNFMFLFFISSVATILFGLLTNSWASDLINSDFVKVILNTPKGQNTFLYDFAANAQILDLGLTSKADDSLLLNQVAINLKTQPVVLFLGISGLVGFVALLTGYLLKALNSLKQSNIANFLEDTNWFVFAVLAPVALIGMVTGAGWTSILLATLAVLVAGFFVFNTGKGIVGKIISGFGKIYGLISFISDAVSFTRLAAVGLTGTIVGFVINLMAGLVMGTEFSIIGFILGVIVLIIGHTLNFVLAAFGAYINPLRLHYVEFMPKFYEGQARPLKPTVTEPTYTTVETV